MKPVDPVSAITGEVIERPHGGSASRSVSSADLLGSGAEPIPACPLSADLLRPVGPSTAASATGAAPAPEHNADAGYSDASPCATETGGHLIGPAIPTLR